MSRKVQTVPAIQKTLRMVVPKWGDYRRVLPCPDEFETALKMMLTDPKQRAQAVAVIAEIARSCLKFMGITEKGAVAPVAMQFNFDGRSTGIPGGAAPPPPPARAEEGSDETRVLGRPSRGRASAPPGGPGTSPEPEAGG